MRPERGNLCRNAVCGRRAYAVKMLPYELSVAELAALRRDEKSPVVVDVREPWEIATASLPGTVNMPMGDVPARAHQELDPEAAVVVMCHHGARSLSVTNWLRQQGFDKAQSLAGGIDQWSLEIDGSVPRY
ncbi:rhodanese-like domain-containing protein [Terriglobus sp.]|uniref:rhodanese-like domain-containing protein n=1 Tax=Terriglobus sp. TaxID=1889013 RepID=UPI003B0030E3